MSRAFSGALPEHGGGGIFLLRLGRLALSTYPGAFLDVQPLLVWTLAGPGKNRGWRLAD